MIRMEVSRGAARGAAEATTKGVYGEARGKGSAVEGAVAPAGVAEGEDREVLGGEVAEGVRGGCHVRGPARAG
jgi:hypothetical protein